MRKAKWIGIILLLITVVTSIAVLQCKEEQYDHVSAEYIGNNGFGNIDEQGRITIVDSSDPYILYYVESVTANACSIDFAESFADERFVQLFYASADGKFSEEKTIISQLNAGASELTFLLPQESISFLRVDFQLAEGTQIAVPGVCMLVRNEEQSYSINRLLTTDNLKKDMKLSFFFLCVLCVWCVLEKNREKSFTVSCGKYVKWILLGICALFILSFAIKTFPLHCKLNLQNVESEIEIQEESLPEEQVFPIYEKGLFYRIPVSNLVNHLKVVSEDDLLEVTTKLYYNNFIVGDATITQTADREYDIALQYQTTKIRIIAIGTMLFDIVAGIILLLWLKSKIKDNMRITFDSFDKLADVVYQSVILSCLFNLFLNFGQKIWQTGGFTHDEIVFLSVALVGVMALIRTVENNRWALIFSFLIIGTALIMSIYHMTAYISVDEPLSYAKCTFLKKHDMWDWEYGCSKMDYVIMGSVWALIRDETFHTIQMAKLLRWLVAVALLSHFCMFIVRKVKYSARISKGFLFTTSFVLLCISPVMLVAIKHYNYDFFSLIFGIGAVLYGVRALEQENKWYAWIAFFMAAFATSEKVVAYPLLLLMIVELIWVENRNHSRSFLHAAKIAIKAHGWLLLFSELTNLYIQYYLRGDIFPNTTLSQIWGNLFSYSLHFVKIIFRSSSTMIYIWAVILSILITMIGYYVFVVLGMIWNRYYKQIKFVRYAEAIILAILFVIGGCLTYRNPFALMSQELDYAGVECSVTFLIAIGTIMPICTMVFFIGYCVKKYAYLPIYDFILLFTAVVSPFAFAFAFRDQTHQLVRAGYRYQNIWIMAFVLCVFLLTIQYVLESCMWKKAAVNGMLLLVCGVIMLEAVPFQPAYTTFVPLWARGVDYDRIVDLEHATIGFPSGWGEDTMLAGEAVKEYIDSEDLHYDEVKLYVDYPGEWTQKPGYFEILRMPGSFDLDTSIIQYELEDIPVADNDFYAFSRQGMKVGNMEYVLPPAEYQPIITIKQANLTKIWIYTGAQIKDYLYEVRNNAYENPYLFGRL